MQSPAQWRVVMTLTAGFLSSIAVYPRLSAVLAADPSLAVAPLTIAGVMPTAATVGYLIFRRLWREDVDLVDRFNGLSNSPNKLSSASSHTPSSADAADAIHAIAARVVLFMIAIHLLILANLTGAGWIRSAAPRIVVVLFGTLFIVVGNLLPRTRPNLAIGIRTAATLGDRRIWIQTHRTAGYAAVALGVVIAAAGLFLTKSVMGVVIGTSGLAAAAAVVMAYRRVAHA